ncbi:hypothetical protein SODALDRAFT_93253 [Sodiomyces alkalinus F11]|uniref:Uncharacterized protein n=1 Tax=Sodiomyces alkalinus (strain CBS 110278 / VKM F-3762 / F11) TaxID=1314773 RepID=A0A3N2Q0N9_SODAK|nr:hypothetical protein SODALDRAFT_93253 [Sodiomyces alkalinus F11]ROT40300.1 hypothetical protein SODALDRAFT_93253 [Sodiomyces alkalinus F11]
MLPAAHQSPLPLPSFRFRRFLPLFYRHRRHSLLCLALSSVLSGHRSIFCQGPSHGLAGRNKVPTPLVEVWYGIRDGKLATVIHHAPDRFPHLGLSTQC